MTPAEAGALGFLAQVLGDAGFEVHRTVFSAPGTPDVENLYARFGVGHPYCCFAGHTDVVPPGDEAALAARSAFGGVVEDGVLYGRGAVDMKGGVACIAGRRARLSRPTGAEFAGSIGFLITGDEEGPAVNGTVKLLGWAHARGERFDHCLARRADQPRSGSATRSRSAGAARSPARLVVHGRAGPRRLPASRPQPDPRHRAPARPR